jgi:hypothetical protein
MNPRLQKAKENLDLLEVNIHQFVKDVEDFDYDLQANASAEKDAYEHGIVFF